MPVFLSDLVYACRLLLRRPGFTAASVITLALGIGANFALFGTVNSVLLKPFPFEEPERLVDVRLIAPEEFGDRLMRQSWLNTLDLRETAGEVVALAAWDWEPFALAGGDRPLRVGGLRVTADYFDVLGLDPILGRMFSDQEADSGSEVLVIGERLWRNHFGGDPAIVGRSVVLDGRPATVVGVAPTVDPYEGELWYPLRASSEPEARGNSWLGVLGRIRGEHDLASAQAALRNAFDRLVEQYPEHNEGRTIVLQSLRDALVGPVEPIFLLLLGVVVLVLLIVCANVANLQLTRSTERHQEMAVRAALGAGRRRLLGQLLTESAVLAVLGLAGGLALGWLGGQRIASLLPGDAPLWLDTSPDWRVMAYTVTAAFASLLLFGLLPAWRSSRRRPSSTRGGGASRPEGRLRSALAVAQVALSAILLVGAVLLVRSLFRLNAVEPGFEAEGAIAVGLDLLAYRSDDQELERMFDRHMERLSSIPGVTAVGVTDAIPFGSRTNFMSLTRDGEDYTRVLVLQATAGYRAALGLPLLEGRDLSPSDRPVDQPEVLVSRRVADQMELEAGDSVVWFGSFEENPPRYRVVGIVGDARQRGLEREPDGAVYVAADERLMSRGTWVVRGDGDPEPLLEQVRAAVAEVDPTQPLHDAGSLVSLVETSLWQQRFVTTLAWFFAALAAALAALGLYGVMAYDVSLRRHELGVRMALGAAGARVVRMVAGQGMRLVLLGLAIGLPLALLLGRGLQGLLYGVGAFDGVSVVAATALLLAVGALSVFVPARRAARVDPATTLRQE
ncbi:MAG TPA: ADOP family duplicated permease [Thermoanaerobaculia bacterium]|nr:ADOP family duplicated permease [Thermoanaerobaculia bacterium]